MLRFWEKQRLLFKLITIVLISILTTLILLYILLSQRMATTTQQNEEENLLNLGRQVANQELVKEAVATNETNDDLIQYTNSLNENFNLDYTVVLTLDSIRLTHPSSELIYKPFQGNDQYRVFEGLEYTSFGDGTLGRSLRSFNPIYNEQNEIIGAVSMGLTIQNLEGIMRKNTQTLTIAFASSIIIGITAATLVAYSLKKDMHDMEPKEIARVLEERNAMMEYAADAVLVTNNKNEIILKNQQAKKEFNVQLDPEEPINIFNKLPFLKDKPPEMEHSNRSDTIYSFNDKEYIVSHAPVLVDSKNVGSVYMLRDATELHILTSQLYSTFEYAYTLEAQSHDFLNKLHVIYGLTDLEEYNELKDYLKDLIEPEQEFSKRVAYLIHNPAIAGFLVGERRKFSENQRAFTIEVYPDIPASDHFKFTQFWIEKVTYIHNLLVSTDQLTEVHLELGYVDEKILTTYRIRGNIEPVLQKIRHSKYSKAIKEYGNGWLTIYFEEKYRKQNDFEERRN